MSESTALAGVRRGTPHASLAALGVKLCQLDFFAPVQDLVQIAQKTIKHTPINKLYDAFIACLAGARGMVEIEHCLRVDPALQAAFGRQTCAEQSVIQDTLNACTEANVAQMQAAVRGIYQRHSQGYAHDYAREWQVLDVDMSGLPCGKKAACASKGYFAKTKNRRGRQLGRVLATRYREIVADRLFEGTTQLTTALQPLVEAAEEVLDLDAARRARTVLRVDAGGGTVEQVNWVLGRGYQFHGKDYSGRRATKLAAAVTQWYSDAQLTGREFGWVGTPAAEYTRPVWRIAVRCPKASGGWRIGVLLSTLAPEAMLALMGQPAHALGNPAATLQAYVDFYDQRGGGVETSIKEDKQGLGMTRRNKKRFPAQQMLMQLNALAHNVLVWAKTWLAPASSAVGRLGIPRLIRDVFGVAGAVELGPGGRPSRIILNQADRWALRLVDALRSLVAPAHVDVILGQT